MNEVLNKLAAEGCSIDSALYRIGGDEDFLLTCIKMTIGDASFAKLGDSIATGNVKEAFEAAHSLKGICANTGLDPLTAPAREITEVLRAGSLDGVKEMYDAMMGKHELLRKVLD